MQARAFTPRITIADQPTEADLRALKADGYVGVINLRNDGEPDQPVSTAQEGAIVRAEGLDYLHHAVGSVPLTASGVAAVSQFLGDHVQGKVLVHCRKGPRAVALVLLHLALTEGWPASVVLERGEALGLRIDPPGLRALVGAYLESQTGA